VEDGAAEPVEEDRPDDRGDGAPADGEDAVEERQVAAHADREREAVDRQRSDHQRHLPGRAPGVEERDTREEDDEREGQRVAARAGRDDVERDAEDDAQRRRTRERHDRGT
jgi:hypothetical protein